MIQLAAIQIFPLKSFDPVAVDQCQVLPSGALANDRRFALLDADGNFVNGKRHAAVHQLRADFSDPLTTVRFTTPSGEEEQFDLQSEREHMARWLSDFFGFSVSVQENAQHGFPDDLEAPGPTLISTATLQEVGIWFDGLPLLEMRRRFRANLEISADEPFWEDRLFGPPGNVVPFRIGGVNFLGVNPCQRCVVPTRWPDTGEACPGFSKLFAEQRERSLPEWAARERFNHFYRLAINTRLGQAEGGVLRVGDPLELLG